MSVHPTQLHQNKPVAAAGRPLAEATTAMLLLHGRGASASNILALADHLPHPEMAYLAPQAAGHTWYPYSFLYPLKQNQPYLDSALQRITELIQEIEASGIPTERIILAGFSQGACLCSEYMNRHPQRYGGLLAFSGGLIGPKGTLWNETGDLARTPVFLGCSDVDFHIPKERVEKTAAILSQQGADVTLRLYPGMDHTIIHDEIVHANQLLATL